MVNHIGFRKFNPALIEFRFVGGSIEPRTDLWIVPLGAEPPDLDVKAFVAFQFGKISKSRLEKFFGEYFNALLNDENSSGYIVNYGTPTKIAQRERLIVDTIRGIRFDRSRLVFVNGGRSGTGVRTVMWIAPEGAEPPKP